MPRQDAAETESFVQDYLEGRSVSWIAAQHGCTTRAVQGRLSRRGVLRTFEEYRQARQHHVAPSTLLTEVLTGVLLSDASLVHKTGRVTAFLQLEQHPTRLGWLGQIQTEMAQCGVIAKIDTHFRAPTPLNGKVLPGGTFHTLRTLNYIEFTTERHRWYPDPTHGTKPRKVVPRDLRLTPLTLAHWFCGDGVGGDSKGTLGLCTNGFTDAEVDFLILRLQEDLGVTALKQHDSGNRPTILVGKQDMAYKVKTIIEPHIPTCCLYKIQHVRPRRLTGRGRAVPESVVAAIRAERWTTTMRACAERHGVGVGKVWKTWHES